MERDLATTTNIEPASNVATPAQPNLMQQVLAYHERTKHRLERYAAGPETLDWDSQPDPFRVFEGALPIPLPLAAEHLATPYRALFEPDAVTSAALSLESIGILLELALGLSAWKEYGPDRWAVRCNPSSGNLHPTEGYILCQAIPELADGVYHYVSRDHTLEQRCTSNLPTTAPARLWVGLSSIHWREAWKYGERAFRYCQLDTGHAIGALRYAAAALGWRLRLVNTGFTTLAVQLGLNRLEDFGKAEAEEPELLLEVLVYAHDAAVGSEPIDLTTAPSSQWHGRANVLDAHHMYRWPVIDEVAVATRLTVMAMPDRETPAVYPPPSSQCSTPAAVIIRQRRSAQHFDKHLMLGCEVFYTLLDSLLPRATLPWDVWDFTPRLHPIFFVHRVEGLAPGIYAMPRRAAIEPALQAAFQQDFTWTKPVGCPAHVPLYQLTTAECGKLARTMHCHQAIAADSAFTLGMLAEFETILATAPWRYRQLYWEAGLLGQVLYLEAEAAGIRGTGIGCYFDDAFHELLGLSGYTYQSLYHFTVGHPLVDNRILTKPPYPAPQ